jgi:hypothetical protein
MPALSFGICAISVLVSIFTFSVERKDNAYAYACDSKTFDSEDGGTPKAIVPSPDKQKQLVLDRGGGFLIVQGKTRVGRVGMGPLSCCIEAGWAPDSIQFFVMWSDGGGIGEYYVRAFRIVDNKIAELVAPRAAYADFKKHHDCKTRGVNIFILGWTADSEKLLLVPEVYPTSDCEQLGLFRGYLMDAKTGSILKIFGEKETEEIKRTSRKTGVCGPA